MTVVRETLIPSGHFKPVEGKSMEQTVVGHRLVEILNFMKYLAQKAEAEYADNELYQKKMEAEHAAKVAAQKNKK